jgi:hypothetical protein
LRQESVSASGSTFFKIFLREFFPAGCVIIGERATGNQPERRGKKVR